MRQYRHIILTALSFVFITAFQNCSVYKSSGRKYVENGQAKQVHDQNTKVSVALSGKSSSSCEPYIDEATASQAMGTFSSLKLVFDSTSQSASCVISANEPSKVPALDIAVCSVSADNLMLLQNAPDQTMVLDPYGPLSQGSLGYSKKLSNGTTQFVFVGSSDSAMEAVACEFVFDSEADYLAHSDEALEKSSQLVHQIYRTLR